METLNLNPGQTILVSAKGVEGGKVTLEFAQLVKSPFVATGLTSLLNASDDRFAKQKPRFVWETGEKADIQKLFGVDVSELEVGQVMKINKLDPTIEGQKLNIEINESIKPTEWQAANIDVAAKRAGKDGDFIMKDDQHIFVNARIVMGEPKHVIFTGTTRQAVLTAMDAESIAAALSGE